MIFKVRVRRETVNGRTNKRKTERQIDVGGCPRPVSMFTHTHRARAAVDKECGTRPRPCGHHPVAVDVKHYASINGQVVAEGGDGGNRLSTGYLPLVNRQSARSARVLSQPITSSRYTQTRAFVLGPRRPPRPLTLTVHWISFNIPKCVQHFALTRVFFLSTEREYDSGFFVKDCFKD